MKAYLTLDLNLRNKYIQIWLPKRYVPVDGYIDGAKVNEDGFNCLVQFKGVKKCFIDKLHSSENGVIVKIRTPKGDFRRKTPKKFKHITGKERIKGLVN